MPIIVQCPRCSKKLKIKEPTPGRKIRCPSCQEPFLPKPVGGSGGGKPGKKRPARADDDLVDDDYEDDYEDSRPQRRKAAPASGRSGRRSSARRKPPAKSGSKAPLFIGVAVLGIALAGGLTWMLMGSGEDDSIENEVAGNDEHAENAGAPTNPAMASSGGGAGAHGGGGGAHGGGGQPANVAQSSNSDNGGSTSSRAEYVQKGSVDLSYIPAESEAVVKIEIGRLLEGPLGQFLQMPQVAPQIQQAEQVLGIKVTDIESVTVGVGGLSALAENGRPPQPSDLPVMIVVRTKVALNGQSLMAMVPGGEQVQNSGLEYTRVPGPGPSGPSAAIRFVDSNTVVLGIEEVLVANGAAPLNPEYIDTALFDGKSPIQILFSPARPDSLFRNPAVRIPPQVQGPPAAMTLARNFLAGANGAFIGIDLTNDIGVNFNIRCRDSAAAGNLKRDFAAANEESKAAQANGPANPMMIPFMGIQKAMEESQSIIASGDMLRVSSSAPGGGQQIAPLIPLAMAMIGPQLQGMQGGPGGNSPGMMGGGPPIRVKPPGENLRNICLGMSNFHELYRRMPNSLPQGVSHAGLSWRVHLLPFLGHESLYKQFDVNQPWDSETNMALIDQMPDVYRTEEVSDATKTVYQVPSSPGSLFEAGRGRSYRDIIDGTSNTIMMVKTSPEKAVLWTQPGDFQVDMTTPSEGLLVENGGFRVGLADGSIVLIDSAADLTKLRALFTYRGAEPVSPGDLESSTGF